jgi:hypothetical protein
MLLVQLPALIADERRNNLPMFFQEFTYWLFGWTTDKVPAYTHPVGSTHRAS